MQSASSSTAATTAVEGVNAKILIPYTKYLYLESLEDKLYPDDESGDGTPEEEEMNETPAEGEHAAAANVTGPDMSQLKRRQAVLEDERERLQALDLERELEKQTVGVGGYGRGGHSHMYSPYPPVRGRGRGRGGRGTRGMKKATPAGPSPALSKLYYIG